MARYVAGPTFGSCGGLLPLAKAFLALLAKNVLIMLFGVETFIKKTTL